MKQTTLLAIVVIGSLAVAGAADRRPVNGTIWAANRGAHTIRGFDAATGALVKTIAMSPNSQPGDLAYAKGRIYVAEEFGTPPAVAVIDPELPAGSEVVQRITFPTLPATARPHHVHASQSGNLVAIGLYGTDKVAVIDTSDDTLLGPWDSNPASTNGRIHAGVFSNDGNMLYLANEGANELVAMEPRSGVPLWRMAIPSIHELALTHDGKTAYVSRRGANRVAIVNLEDRTWTDVLMLGLPDTLELSADEKTLTVGLRTMPAQTAVVDTNTLAYELVTLSVAGETTTIAGHQWTAPSGRYTFASFEGGAHPGIAVIDHKAGNQVIQRLDYPGRPHGVDHGVK
jgi:DNA-binding beta-propeller fold protein YncE